MMSDWLYIILGFSIGLNIGLIWIIYKLESMLLNKKIKEKLDV